MRRFFLTTQVILVLVLVATRYITSDSTLSQETIANIWRVNLGLGLLAACALGLLASVIRPARQEVK
jgi:hypothetical protein